MIAYRGWSMKFNLNFGEDIYYNISLEHLDNYFYMRFEAAEEQMKFVRIRINVSILCRLYIHTNFGKFL